MENFKEIIKEIDIDSLLKVFNVQIAIVVLVVFIVFRNLFSRLIIKAYYKIMKIDKNTKDSPMYNTLNKFFVIVGIGFAIKLLPISEHIKYYSSQAFRIIAIYLIFKTITILINEESILFKTVLKNSKNQTVNAFFCRIVRVFLWMIFIVIVISEFGFDLSDFGVLVTGLGIGSAVIALAAQDLVKSLISGFVILTDKPFTIGDWVEVGQFQGMVVDITFRSTRIQSYNKSIVTIPNSIVTAEYIINWNKLPSRRFDTILSLSLDTTSDQMKSVIKKIRVVLENNPEITKETVQVHFHQITDHSYDIKIFLYTKRTGYTEFLEVKQEILCSLLELLERENIDLVYPTQTLFVKNKEEIGK